MVTKISPELTQTSHRILPPTKVTLNDVAAAAGVTAATVSFTLSGKRNIAPHTREAVLNAVRELGYEPNINAQRLANGRCHDTIGLFARQLDLGVTALKMRAIQGLLLDEGYRVPIHTCGYSQHETADEQASLLKDLRRQRPRAIVCYNERLPKDALDELHAFQEEGGALVAYDYPIVLACDQVIFDREDNSYQAAHHLLELGHQHLGLYMPGQHQPQHPRVTGFERALADRGLNARPEWFFCGGQYQEGGALLAEQFLRLQERPTGLCVVNDDAATTFITQIERAGVRVPDDVSVVSHDDLPTARYYPTPLTAVSQPIEEIGRVVVDLLKSRMSDDEIGPPRQVKLRGELTVRSSTAAPRTT